MRPLRILTLFLVLAWPGALAYAAGSAHDYDFVAIDGQPLPFKGFAGKVVLVVNTASFCGYTDQYRDLKALWDRYRDRGLVVLGVPSNDFGGQEPGSNDDIKAFCQANYDVDFPLTEKVTVTGAAAHPFYRWARQELGAMQAPTWNFHKYLVDRSGRLVRAFETTIRPTAPQVQRAIEAALAAR
ncbi:MAG: glutathione peroxidase [Alphaproteobacteria bacterium]|nr:glutathione peroxidase [Alphaproteobacteria bacterium]